MRRLPTTVLGVLAVALLAGCGQSNPDLIPESHAQALQQTADNIQAACADADRGKARNEVKRADTQIAALPRDVDPELKQNLQDWMDHIQSQIKADCQAEETPTPTPSPTPTATEAPPTPTPTASPTPTATEAPTQPPVETPTAAPTESAPPPVEPTATP